MSESGETLRLLPASSSDADAINALIEQAIDVWDLPQRVKRLSASSYFYDQIDIQEMDIRLLTDAADGQRLSAVMALESPAQGAEQSNRFLNLHGLFVSPDQQGRGLGSWLLGQAHQIAVAQSARGILIRAQRDADGFFQRAGCQRLTSENSPLNVGDYPYLWWLPVDAG